MASIKYVIELSGEEKEQLKAIVPFPVSWTVKKFSATALS